MHTIKLDGALLWDPRVPELRIINPKVNCEVNRAGTLEFIAPAAHPLYTHIKKMKSIVEVYQDGSLIFRGRPLTDNKDFLNNRQVICEGDLAFFNDSVIRPYTYNGSITGYLQMILDAHNAQVDPEKRFALGSVTVTDPNNYITRSSINPVNAWPELDAKLLNLLGGYLIIRHEGGIHYLDYLADSPYLSDQTVEIGSNLLDVTQQSAAGGIITALIPYGAKILDGEGKETGERQTISIVNGGVDYLYSQTAVDTYGWIFGSKTWDDVNDPSNLMTKAAQELAVRTALGTSVEIKAVDLSMLNPDIDKIRFFQYVPVKSPGHGIDTIALITKLSLDLTSPQNNLLTFGFDHKNLTDQKVSADKVIRQIEADYVTNDAITVVRDSIVSLASAIIQTAEEIKTEVSRTYTSQDAFSSYQQALATRLIQDAEKFDFQFTEMQKSIETVDGKQVAKFNEISKHITFDSGDILLKATSSDPNVNTRISLLISRDRISFMDNGAEVAYISDNKLYIYDGHFINSLRVGNFSFRPRSNGSLSFGRVV